MRRPEGLRRAAARHARAGVKSSCPASGPDLDAAWRRKLDRHAGAAFVATLAQLGVYLARQGLDQTGAETGCCVHRLARPVVGDLDHGAAVRQAPLGDGDPTRRPSTFSCFRALVISSLTI